MGYKLEFSKSRRCFLKSAGGAALSIPFLQSLAPSEVLAQTAGSPKRLITFRTQNGELLREWFPTTPANLDLGPNAKYRTLTGTPGPISNLIGSEFDEFKSKMLVFKGLDLMIGGHDREARTLSGFYGDLQLEMGVGHISLDQILAHSTKFYPSTPPKRIIHLSTPIDRQGLSVIKVGDKFQRPVAMGRAQVAYDSIFGDLVKFPDTASRQKLAADRRSLLDLVINEYKALQGSRHIASVDKIIAEEYADNLRDLEKGISALAQVTCQIFPRPGNEPDLGELTDADYGTFHTMNSNAQMDIAALAIRCGITQIVNFHFFRGDTYRWMPFKSRNDHHGLSHNIDDSDDTRERWKAISRYNLSIAARLLKNLNVADPYGSGTILDNSLVYMASELGEAQAHSALCTPLILVGGLGKLKTNRYIDYTTNIEYKRQKIGRPYNEVFNTIFSVFGLTPAEYEQGQLGFGYYGDRERNQLYDLSDKRRVLPYVFG